MILIRIEIYNFSKEDYEFIEALIDTGATICAISRHVGEKLGIPMVGRKVHLWQVRDPLVLEEINIKLRYRGEIYDVEAVAVDIPLKFRRKMLKKEECTRPEYRNPLSERILLGENFLKNLSEEERGRIIGMMG